MFDVIPNGEQYTVPNQSQSHATAVNLYFDAPTGIGEQSVVRHHSAPRLRKNLPERPHGDHRRNPLHSPACRRQFGPDKYGTRLKPAAAFAFSARCRFHLGPFDARHFGHGADYLKEISESRFYVIWVGSGEQLLHLLQELRR